MHLRRLSLTSAAALALLAAFGPGRAGAAPSTRPTIVPNDNRVAAGRREGTTVDVALDAETARWAPDGPNAPVAVVDAFAERGRAPQVPGPLLRVRVGTDIRVRLRNTLASTLYVHDLVDLPSTGDRPIALAPGGERIVRLHTYRPGTYLYWASTSTAPIARHYGADALLSGAIVVDAPGVAPADRIFVIDAWDDVYKKSGRNDFAYGVYTVNGRSWPHTERLTYERGTPVTWRLVNASFEPHPMHLHGFPFAVLERGTGTNVAPVRDETEVTEWLPPGGVARIRWSAARPGAWMFHCHLAYHMLPHNPASLALAGKTSPGGGAFADGQHVPMTGAMTNAMMGGLILSVAIRDPHDASRPPDVAPRTRLELDVEPGPGATPGPDEPVYPAFRYALAGAGAATKPDDGSAPTIFLTRGVPAGIMVVNHLAEATSVHWHGIELQDSYQDGNGLPDPWGRPATAIAPGGRRESRFTPPRAGTFMYHTHADDAWQLGGGLVGPLIVLEPGATFDPTTDHIVLVTSPRDVRAWDRVDVNGRLDPAPIEMTTGVTQRLRLLNLTETTDEATAYLRGPAEAVPAWRLIARDGFALRTPRDAPPGVRFTIGATRDLMFRPTSVGDLTLEIRDDFDASTLATIPIHVRAAAAGAAAVGNPGTGTRVSP